MQGKKLALIIMDGWAKGKDDKNVNAIAAANTPFIDSLYGKYPNSQLKTHGEDVGLPVGQMGNSEVGHLNLGAGRVVYQPLVRINKAFQNGEVAQNTVIQNVMTYAQKHNKNVHIMGLLSNGGVHSSMDHLKGLLDIAHQFELKQVYVHAFTDGRDTDPKSGANFIKDIEKYMKKTCGKLASVIGRYYAMDRDLRWERIQKAYDLLVHGKGEFFENALDAVNDSYKKGVTDEFIQPKVITGIQNKALTTIQSGDVVICFNFRTDRGREITTALTQNDIPEYKMKKLSLVYVTLTEYDKNFKDVKIIFEPEKFKNTLGEVISENGLTQLRIAETEKYPHVSYFFSGGREKEFKGEKRMLIPSPKVATYDLKPEMSAYEVTENVIKAMNSNEFNLIVLNLANPDMVAHTGVFEAVVKAVETVDKCASKIIDAVIQNDYICLLTSDHGNADYMVNPDGSPNTAHSLNDVPLFLINADKNIRQISKGRLADIAPSILNLLDISVPKEMTGCNLIEK